MKRANGMAGLSLWFAITLVVLSIASANEFTAWMEAHNVHRRCLELVPFADMGLGFKVRCHMHRNQFQILHTFFFSMNQPCLLT